jgi:hypothetical protein
MVKQTAVLFIKALIIGLILNGIISLVPVTTTKLPENPSPFDNHQILEAPADENLFGASD